MPSVPCDVRQRATWFESKRVSKDAEPKSRFFREAAEIETVARKIGVKELHIRLEKR